MGWLALVGEVGWVGNSYFMWGIGGGGLMFFREMGMSHLSLIFACTLHDGHRTEQNYSE